MLVCIGLVAVALVVALIDLRKRAEVAEADVEAPEPA
jgi:hypothetical protein